MYIEMWSLLRTVLCLLFIVSDLGILGSVSENVRENDSKVSGIQDNNIKKRYDADIQNCIENFDIHSDKIIRTQDSLDMGAKYINEVEVASREECLRLCCETNSCDVFVFEEKVPGSCYMFHCGPVGDFRCKFTKHRNYSSAVMAGPHSGMEAASELEQQIRLTKHEQQLTNLRKSESLPASSALEQLPAIPESDGAASQPAPPPPHPEALATPPPPTHPPPPPPPPPAPTQPPTTPPGRRCSRYQFECRESGECIAIYNACDGIPQCADGSDEAVELGCPAPAPPPTTIPPPPPPPPPTLISPVYQQVEMHPEAPPVRYGPSQQQLPSQVHKQQVLQGDERQTQHMQQQPLHAYQYQSASHIPENEPLPSQQQQQHQQQFKQPPHQQKYVENGMLLHVPVQQAQRGFYNQDSWQSQHQYQQYDDQNSHIFNHKGSGLVTDTDRYKHTGKHPARYNPAGQYNEVPHEEFNKYGNNVPANYYNNGQYQMPSLQNNWQGQQQPNAINPNMVHTPDEVPPVGQSRMSAEGPQSYGTGPVPPDYFYEESQEGSAVHGTARGQHTHSAPQGERESIVDSASLMQVKPQQPQQQHLQRQHHRLPPGQVEGKIINSPPENSQSRKNYESVDIVVYTTQEPSLHRDSGMKASHSEHSKNSSHTRHPVSPSQPLRSEGPDDTDIIVEPVDGEAVRPSGAILSLALGLCVTGIMVVLVGCRLRVVRKRLRRGGKSPYAHEADYLVNGMYL
ncbi:uncharacterized protein LOC126194676 isoform X1 [Schistocerca nitens]|uniref:uncharacterized protein LOC126194676 isoform X1 n=1 Tax=Schistocerca nitens TaxID=7011 RepID=UPI00211920F3|nr:uncharacterized protein LOC126194676 isoform X1 [Schistocerca nitens]